MWWKTENWYYTNNIWGTIRRSCLYLPHTCWICFYHHQIMRWPRTRYSIRTNGSQDGHHQPVFFVKVLKKKDTNSRNELQTHTNKKWNFFQTVQASLSLIKTHSEYEKWGKHFNSSGLGPQPHWVEFLTGNAYEQLGISVSTKDLLLYKKGTTDM